MTHYKPTETTDVIGKLGIRPTSDVRDYFISKASTKFEAKKPNYDTPGESATLFLIHCERENAALKAAQKDHLEHMRQQMETDRMREKYMKRFATQLRSHFIDVNFFFRENQDKKQIALKQIEHEVDIQKQLIESIEKSKKTIEIFLDFRKVIQQTFEELEPYEKVIDDHVKGSKLRYRTHKEFTDHVDSLLLTNVEIQKMQEEKFLDMEQMHKRIIQQTESAKLKILGLSTQLTQLERLYHRACNECQLWERTLARVSTVLTRDDLNKKESRIGIYQLFSLLASRSNAFEFDSLFKTNCPDMCDFIQNEIFFLKEVLNECRKKKEKTDKMLSRC